MNDAFDVATNVKYGVASSLSWPKHIRNMETAITRLRVPRKTTTSCHKQTLEMGTYKPTCTYLTPRHDPRFPHSWLKLSNSHG